jgi:hypothetical protein
MSLPKSTKIKTYTKTDDLREIKIIVPIIQKIEVEKVVQVVKKFTERKIVGEKEIIKTVPKTIVKTISTITHKDINYKDKRYTVCYTSFNEDDILFLIDFDKKEKVISKKWHYKDGGYIGNTYYEDNNFKSKREIYLHNFVMNKLTFDGKGQHHTIDHINRIGSDNRLENLRDLSQSYQNINQKKRERICELPEECGINPQDIPKNIYYRKPEGLHGDRFYLEIKFTDPPFKWFSSSSKKIDLKTKLQHAILKLDEYKQENPEYAELLDTLNNVKQRNDLRKSFNDILQLSGFPQEIINKNLAVLEEENEQPIDQQAKDLAKQLINEGFKSVTSNLPSNCRVTPEMIPKYCYYKPASDKRGDKFIIERHPSLTKNGTRQWATTEAKSKTTKEKFDLMLEKMNELNKLII